MSKGDGPDADFYQVAVDVDRPVTDTVSLEKNFDYHFKVFIQQGPAPCSGHRDNKFSRRKLI